MGTSSLSGLCHCKLNIKSSHNMKTLFFGILLTLCVVAKGQDKKPEINCDAVGIVCDILKDAVDGSLMKQNFPMPTGPTPKAEDDGMKDEDMTKEDMVKAAREMLGNSTFDAADKIFKDYALDDLLAKIVTGNMNMTEMGIAIEDAFKADGSSMEDPQKSLMENCPELMSNDGEGSDMDSDGGSDGGFGGSNGGSDAGFGSGSDGVFGGSNGGSEGGFGGSNRGSDAGFGGSNGGSDTGFGGSDGGFGGSNGGSDGGFGGSDGGFGGGSDGGSDGGFSGGSDGGFSGSDGSSDSGSDDGSDGGFDFSEKNVKNDQ